eukprot:jgi/Bigna1/73018/fgenesh1_pg.22_\
MAARTCAVTRLAARSLDGVGKRFRGGRGPQGAAGPKRFLSFWNEGREDWGMNELLKVGNQLSVFKDIGIEGEAGGLGSAGADDVAWAIEYGLARMSMAQEHVSKTGEHVARDSVAQFRKERCVAYASWFLPTLTGDEAKEHMIEEVKPLETSGENLVWYPSPQTYPRTLSAFTHPDLIPPSEVPYNTTRMTGKQLLNTIDYLSNHNMEAFGFNTAVDMRSGKYASFSAAEVLPHFLRWLSVIEIEAVLHALILAEANPDTSDKVLQVKNTAAATFLDSGFKVWVLGKKDSASSRQHLALDDGGQNVLAFLAPDIAMSYALQNGDVEDENAPLTALPYKPMRLNIPIGQFFERATQSGRGMSIPYRQLSGSFESFFLAPGGG